MNSTTQILVNDGPASGAHLGGVFGIDRDDFPTSIFSFVGTQKHKPSPRTVKNRSVQRMPRFRLNQTLDVKILKDKNFVLVGQFPRSLVKKIVTLVVDLLIGFSKHFPGLGSFRSSLGLLSQLFLSFGNSLQCLSKKLGILNGSSIGKSDESLTAQVNSYNPLATLSFSAFWLNDRKSCKPLTRFSFDGHSFDDGVRRNFPMKVNLDQANFGKVKSFVVQHNSIPVLRISQRVVSPETLESWIAGLFAFLNSLKESTKGKVNSLLGVLKDLRMNSGKFRFLRFPFWQEIIRVKTTKRLLFSFPCILPSCQSFVVSPATQFKRFFQQGFLGCCWLKSELVGRFIHTKNIGCCLQKSKWFLANIYAIHPRNKFRGLLAEAGGLPLADKLLADIDGKVNRIIGSLMGDSTAPNKLGLIDTVRKHEVQITMLQTAENRCSVRRTLDTHLQEHEKAPRWLMWLGVVFVPIVVAAMLGVWSVFEQVLMLMYRG